MENRRKFYVNYKRKNSGAWSGDTLNDRYQHIYNALNAYDSGMDFEDLKFDIKNAFVSRIYVSAEVVKKYPKAIKQFGYLSQIYNNQLVIYNIRSCETPQCFTETRNAETLGQRIFYLKSCMTMSYDVSRTAAPIILNLQKVQNIVNYSSQRPQKTCINSFFDVNTCTYCSFGSFFRRHVFINKCRLLGNNQRLS